MASIPVNKDIYGQFTNSGQHPNDPLAAPNLYDKERKVYFKEHEKFYYEDEEYFMKESDRKL